MNRVVRVSTVMMLLGFGVLSACDKSQGPLRVDQVEPPQGVIGGGDQVSIVGSGFKPGKTQVEVRFGRRRAEQVVIASGSQINVVTPAGEKGPVDVTLSFNDGSQFKIPQGFRYTAPQANDDVRRAFFTKQGQGGAPPAKTP